MAFLMRGQNATEMKSWKEKNAFGSSFAALLIPSESGTGRMAMIMLVVVVVV